MNNKYLLVNAARFMIHHVLWTNAFVEMILQQTFFHRFDTDEAEFLHADLKHAE